MKLRDRAYQYSVKLIQFLDVMQKDMASTIITHQLLRSATSVGANIVEASGSSSRREFANFYHHSLKSANESLYWLELLRDAKKVQNPELEILLNETRELSKILGSSILTLKGKK